MAPRALPTGPPSVSTPFELIAFGGSAGGMVALRQVLSRLPDDFRIPIVVVHHLAEASRLPEVLNQQSSLPCRWAEYGERPQAGVVLVARPGGNIVLGETGSLEASPGPKLPMGWPSVDIFLRSMAAHLGPRGIAVVLSGMMHDGADGITAVRRSGGATLVQDPRTAEFPEMPSAAVDLGRADLMMPTEQIAEALQILAERGVQ